MSTEENKAKARRLYEEIAKNNLSVIDELVAANVVYHNPPPGLASGIQGYKQLASMYLGAFPDMQLTIESQVAEGDKVATIWTAHGTHKGELMGIPASGNSVMISGITVQRFEGGKIAEEWEQFDSMGMMQQIGAMPKMG